MLSALRSDEYAELCNIHAFPTTMLLPQTEMAALRGHWEPQVHK